MEDYNRLISSRILDGYERMIDRVPQPLMFGGKRMRNYVLPGSTEYDYPGSLSVGTMDGKTPATLDGAFWKDFNNAFHRPTAPRMPPGSGVEGGVRAPDDPEVSIMPVRPRGRKPKIPLEAGAILPVREGKPKYSTMPVVPKLPGPGRRRKTMPIPAVPEMDGGSKKSNRAFVRGMKKFGKMIAPVAKDVGMLLAKEGIKQGVKYATTPSKSAAPAAGGALLRNEPAEFHSSVYPPALASYTPGKDAYGRGRTGVRKIGGGKEMELPKSAHKRYTARGAIVAEVMKKKGLSLAEASKYVKENGLY